MRYARITLILFAFANTASAIDTLNDSVVLFTSRTSGSPMVHGGGIVVGSDDHAVYIATVGHVATIDDLRVQFYAARGKEYVVHVFPESENAEVDFAVVSVEVPENDPVRRSLRPLAYRTDKLAANSLVMHIGHAGSVWDVIAGNKVLRDQLNNLYITNTSIAAASSGGPIFDEASQLLGLVTQVASTQATTLKVEVILYYLREWKVPMNLLETSATVAPPATPTVAPKPNTQGGILFADRFQDNRNQWPISHDKTGFAQVAGGVYRLAVGPNQFSFRTIPLEIDQNSDFEIRATATLVRGKGIFGIEWGHRDILGHFQFEIIGDDSAHVSKIAGDTGSEGVMLYAPVRTHEPNRLVIRKSDRQVRFLINDVYILQQPFVRFFGDQVGFSVTSDVEAVFDDFEVVQAPMEVRTTNVQIASRPNCDGGLRYALAGDWHPATGKVTKIDNLPVGTITYSIQGVIACLGEPFCTATGRGSITLSGNDRLALDWVDRDACTVRLIPMSP